MSDVHGLDDKFFEMLKLIDLQPEDHVYFLGDVIDRGSGGIKILRYIMNDKRFTLLLGNHEYMMLNYMRTGSQKAFRLWIINGGNATLKAYYHLTKDEQYELLDYLESLPLAICDLKINDKLYYLAHANYDKNYMEGYVYEPDDNYNFIWKRVELDQTMMDDRCLIAGHTVTVFYHNKYEEKIKLYSDNDNLFEAKYIDIDCGCAGDNSISQLCCLRLEDMKDYYV